MIDIKDWLTTLKKRTPYEPLPLEAKSSNQKKYLEYLAKHPMVFGVGPAGTGKTYLAASHAIDQLALGQVEQIILTRATVPVSGENLGFLPGDVNEKMGPWIAELMDIFQERVGKDLLRQLPIKVIPFAFMRGRSFDNSIILVDEMQNSTPMQAKMLVTRIGQNSRMFINGDLNQSDLRGRNGLHELIDMIEDQNLMLPVVHFSNKDIRRSRLCQLWVEAYERKEAA